MGGAAAQRAAGDLATHDEAVFEGDVNRLLLLLLQIVVHQVQRVAGRERVAVRRHISLGQATGQVAQDSFVHQPPPDAQWLVDELVTEQRWRQRQGQAQNERCPRACAHPTGRCGQTSGSLHQPVADQADGRPHTAGDDGDEDHPRRPGRTHRVHVRPPQTWLRDPGRQVVAGKRHLPHDDTDQRPAGRPRAHPYARPVAPPCQGSCDCTDE